MDGKDGECETRSRVHVRGLFGHEERASSDARVVLAADSLLDGTLRWKVVPRPFLALPRFDLWRTVVESPVSSDERFCSTLC